MKIGLDIDGVLYDYHWALYTEMVIHGGVKSSYEQFWVKDVRDYPKLKQENIIRIEPVYSACPPPKTWVEAVKRIAQKHEIFYLTARPVEMSYVTFDTMKKWGYPNLDKLYITDDDKLSVCLREGCDLFVEDRDKYIDVLKDKMKVVVVRKPWNVQYWDTLTCINEISELEGVL